MADMTPEELRRLADALDPKSGMASGIAIPFNERQKQEHKAATELREYSDSLEMDTIKELNASNLQSLPEVSGKG